MSQPSIASFFNNRKRPAGTSDDVNLKNKVFLEESYNRDCQNVCVIPKFLAENSNKLSKNTMQKINDAIMMKVNNKSSDAAALTTRSGRTVKRTGGTKSSTKVKVADEIPKKPKQEQKMCQFIKKGFLSPQKNLTINAFASKSTNQEYITPTKQIIPSDPEKLTSLVRKELNFDEVKTKITRHAKLQELKASLGRLQQLEKTRKIQEEHNKRLKNGELNSAEKLKKNDGITLKEFTTIDLEILTSPKKGFKTPVKNMPSTPNKNELMSPKVTANPKRLLFSPSKDGSPSKIITPPAYQKYLHLTQSPSKTASSTLMLPYKYRYLFEIFKNVDSICAMFFNRKECITFKKLKPAVQRMIRKNFHESHLAQIKCLFPEAFHFYQQKMRNYGSVSKQDYFQLLIVPNIENRSPSESQLLDIDEDNVLKNAQSNAMNPLILLERQRKFQDILLNRVKDEHDKFLKSLDPPLDIQKSKITRWHPDFDLENCSEIEIGHLPQPPNIEKYSSAKDILSTARNLFNCATPMERVMERFQAKVQAQDKSDVSQTKSDVLEAAPIEPDIRSKEIKIGDNGSAAEPPIASLLKGVPKSLLEKIRAKQAAKALDAMTRRPSQDQEAITYSRLPELARHLRNVFITERKSVLPIETIIKKLENSYRTNLTLREFETHIKLIAKLYPKWIEFHDIRKTTYLRISRDIELSKVIEKLEHTANEKSK